MIKSGWALGQPNKTPNLRSSFMFLNFRRVNRSSEIVLNSRASWTFPSERRSLLCHSPPNIFTYNGNACRYLGRLTKYRLITDEWRCFKSSVKISYLGSRGLESGDQTSNSKFLTCHCTSPGCHSVSSFIFRGFRVFLQARAQDPSPKSSQLKVK